MKTQGKNDNLPVVTTKFMFAALLGRFGKILNISLGFILGVSVCLFFFRFIVSDQKSTEEIQKPSVLTLSLTEPTQSVATNIKTLNISGNTAIPSVVTINSPQKNLIIESTDGKFSTKIDLVEGKNTINITAFNKITGESQTLSRDILYLDEFLTNI